MCNINTCGIGEVLTIKKKYVKKTSLIERAGNLFELLFE